LSIPLKELAKVVSFVSSFTSAKDNFSPFSYVWFSKGAVRAFSGAAGAVWKTPWGVEDFSTPADSLAPLLASLAISNDEVEIKLTETRVVIKSGGFRAQLPAWPRDVESPQDWIVRDQPEGGVEVGDDFWADLGHVRGSMSGDDGKPFLKGVYWAPNGAFVSCDNIRATLCYPKPDARHKLDRAKGVLIPAHLLKHIGPSPGFSLATLERDTAIWFSGGAGAVYGQLIATEFPASAVLGLVKSAREYFAGSGPSTHVVFKDDPLPAIDRLLHLSRSSTIRVTVEGAVVRLSVSEVDGNGRSGDDTIAADVGGGSAVFNADGRTFRDAMVISPSFWYGPGKSLYVHNDSTRVEQVVSLLA
jgi:hypothetical protein